MVNFAVVGLGMGRNRAQIIQDTEGAELKCVVDLNEELARRTGEELGTDWVTNLDDALGRSDVDCVMIMTPSGTHAETRHSRCAGRQARDYHQANGRFHRSL